MCVSICTHFMFHLAATRGVICVKKSMSPVGGGSDARGFHSYGRVSISLGNGKGFVFAWRVSLCIGISPPPRISGGLRGGPKISRGSLADPGEGGPSCVTDTGGGFERLFLLPPAVPRRRTPLFTSRRKSLVGLALSGAEDCRGARPTRLEGARFQCILS
jgi:hypothetical protein